MKSTSKDVTKFKIGDEIHWLHKEWDNDFITSISDGEYHMDDGLRWSHLYVHKNAELVIKKEDLFDSIYERLL